MKIKKIINPPAIFYLTGLTLTAIETAYHLLGKSLCQTEGCKIAQSFVKGGEIILLIGGILLFGILFSLTLFEFKIFERQKRMRIEEIILTIALATEGYLLGFQSFIINEFCLFCVVIFGILLISVATRLIQGRKELIVAVFICVSVFFTTYLVNSQTATITSSQYVLVYSKDCPRCEEVIQFCKLNSISVETVEAKKLSGTLKSLGIESVPVLFCNEGVEKKFIIGPDNIKDYFIAKTVSNQKIEGTCPIFKPCQ